MYSIPPSYQPTEELAGLEYGANCTQSYQCFVSLVCNEGNCRQCSTDSQCEATNSKNRCQDSPTGKACMHKHLFPHFDNADLFICFITIITIAVSAPAGTGGGGVLVPMYILVGHFTPHTGIPLSKATIFGAAISNNYYNLQKRHPQADRPLVDYYTAMLLEPVLLAGTVMGVLVNAVSPGWLITVLLVLVLSFTTWRTFQKGMKTYRQECGQGASVDAYAPLVPSPQDGEAIRGVQSYASMGGDAGELGTHDVDAIVEEERHVPRHALLVLAISWVYIFFVAVMKGGEGAQGIVPCGTFGYWAILFSIVPVFGGLQMWSSKVLIARHRRKEAAGYRYLDGDIQWTYTRTLLYPLTCIVAGFCAGALGIAAGTVIGPIMLEMGLSALVGSATSGFMVLFTASSTTVQFLIMGQLTVDYAIFFGLIGCLSAAVGNTVVSWLVKKYKKTYFLVFMLAVTIGLSTVLMGYTGMRREADDIAIGKSPGFRPLCTPTRDVFH